jgi:hypothetical protein
MKTTDLICHYCNKKFTRLTKHVKYAKERYDKSFCSKECLSKAKFVSYKEKCYNCKKEIIVTPSRLKKSKSGRLFCSSACSSSTNNSLYRKDINNPNFTEGLNFHRRLVKENLETICCTRCQWNEFPEILQVHHKDRNRENNEKFNLEILCPNCHMGNHYLNKDGPYSWRK